MCANTGNVLVELNITLSRYQPGPKPVLSCPIRILLTRPRQGHFTKNSSLLKDEKYFVIHTHAIVSLPRPERERERERERGGKRELKNSLIG